MREIKFRVWDGQNMEYIKPVWFEELGIYHYEDFSKCAKELHCILMQYTGLKDKNGKEIYEGDIVKQKPILCDEEKIGVTSIRTTQGVCFGAYPYFVSPCEVIGNIYENPELLKELRR